MLAPPCRQLCVVPGNSCAPPFAWRRPDHGIEAMLARSGFPYLGYPLEMAVAVACHATKTAASTWRQITTGPALRLVAICLQAIPCSGRTRFLRPPLLLH